LSPCKLYLPLVHNTHKLFANTQVNVKHLFFVPCMRHLTVCKYPGECKTPVICTPYAPSVDSCCSILGECQGECITPVSARRVRKAGACSSDQTPRAYPLASQKTRASRLAQTPRAAAPLLFHQGQVSSVSPII
jgi:hypothetical protein